MPVHSPMRGAPARKPGKVTSGGATASTKTLKPNMSDPHSKVSSGRSQGAAKPTKGSSVANYGSGRR